MDHPLATLDAALARFPFPGAETARQAATAGNRGAATPAGVVAFSGGPDSTALLLGLARLRECQGGPEIVAVHLDHAADPGSRARAAHAARLARRLGVPFVIRRLPAAAVAPDGASAEAAARRHRYAFLARVAADCGAAWVATAHHRDDQAETVLLRLLAGSGLRGLGAMRPRRELRVAPPPGAHVPAFGPGAGRAGAPRLVRPLLGLPRVTLAAAVAAAGLSPADDPTNRDRSIARNRVRHHLLPRLEAAAAEHGEPPLAPRLARLAATTRAVFDTVDHRLAERLDLQTTGTGEPAASVALRPLAALPPSLLPHALSLLHAAGGAPYPPGHQARSDLRRQLDAGGRVGCDAGGGWRWESSAHDHRLRLLVPGPSRGPVARAATPAGPSPPREDSPPDAFSYILEVPGEVEIVELGLVLRLQRAAPAPWMYRGSPHRAGLALGIAPGDTVTVRSRRPGDRLRPLGAGGSRRLKDVLIDHRVPRRRRHRLPLLAVDGEIAWVPGVTVGDAFRLPTAGDHAPGATVWLAELAPAGDHRPTDEP